MYGYTHYSIPPAFAQIADSIREHFENTDDSPVSLPELYDREETREEGEEWNS